MVETKVYTNWIERQALVAQYESQGWRMLHDDFDPDWQPGDEPHGTLTFTDEPSPELPPPLCFEASPPGQAIGKRLKNIEDFLEKLYPCE